MAGVETKCYSQRAEEEFILRAIAGFDCPHRFLDIGAYDGVNFSNTMALVERGWGGTLVEPGLEAFQSLLKNHGDNQELTLVHAAIGLTRGLIPFWNNPTTYSTTVESNREKWQSEGFSRPFLVPTICFEDLGPELLRDVEVLSLDTEGTSMDLLLSLPGWFRPKVVCVEHDGLVRKCFEWAERNGYSPLMMSAENLVFAL